ncbi:hypothetical protein PAXINDRAFT_172426 [Paxillus involutus ATCC 200175]|uniref:Dienelactone hydrolase domain-containing protein n=1 Tax=Paxillus involutus ATCC 200175 TaxID=664439 RepID=A0A0C9TFK0_PAXIN|nr:hypothetical protein PAXINDRAFT_172426 [Paxillus involutus ATCC 200175]
MSTTLAGAPGACCFTGVQHSGTPVGRVEDLGGLSTYISEPPAAVVAGTHKKVILFLADIYGPLFINNQLLQDYFASSGFVVLGPDYFFGDAVPNHPPGRDRNAWLQSVQAPANEAFPKWLDAVKAIYGTENTKYCAVGYCFGAPFVMNLAGDGFIVAESHFEKLDRPLLLSCSEEDFTFPLEARRRAEDIMVAKKSTYHFQVFSGVKHGFAVRGNPDIPQERWSKEESARGIKEWFVRFAS